MRSPEESGETLLQESGETLRAEDDDGGSRGFLPAFASSPPRRFSHAVDEPGGAEETRDLP